MNLLLGRLVAKRRARTRAARYRQFLQRRARRCSAGKDLRDLVRLAAAFKPQYDGRMPWIHLGEHAFLHRPCHAAAKEECVVHGLRDRALAGLIGPADDGPSGIERDGGVFVDAIVLDVDGDEFHAILAPEVSRDVVRQFGAVQTGSVPAVAEVRPSTGLLTGLGSGLVVWVRP